MVGPFSPTAHRLAAATLAVAVGLSVALAAQGTRTPPEPPLPGAGPSVAAIAQPSDETATLVFFNRPIVSMRARVLGRRPSERAAAAARVLDDLRRRGSPSQSTRVPSMARSWCRSDPARCSY
jgi:hypothetical protein